MTKRPRVVIVNDKMQRGYRYVLTAPPGRNFDPEFVPSLTPREMLALGVFCGKYMTDCREEFPASWFAHAKLSPSGRDCSLNYFGVNASQPLSVWRKKGWIHPTIREAGSSGTAATIWVAARRRRTRARSGGGRLSGDTLRRLSGTASQVTRDADRASARPCCTGPTIAGRSEASGKRRQVPCTWQAEVRFPSFVY
jgi:hypothetical protein